MSARIRHHIRSNAIGYLALFVALSGTAYATHPGGQNTISSADIINGEVRNGDLGVDSVASGKIADRQVKNADLSIGASSSNTIADGGIQGIDVKNDDLTGDDLDESSLDSASLGFECPAGYELAGKDVCYGGAQSNENFNTALSTCAGNGDRLPTLAEGWALITDLPNPGQFGFEQTWTADQSSGTTQASTLTKNFQGTIARDSVATTTSFPFRCVTSPHG